MASMRAVKSRISSVKSTKQITKAMNLVAASKLQRAKVRLQDTRPFSVETSRVIASIVNNSKGIKHPYLSQRPVKNKLVILISGDRGLCGGYNTNICKAAISVADANTEFITIGSKGRDYVARLNHTIVKSVVGASENPTYEEAAKIGNIILEKFKNQEIDEVYLAYTEFASTISHEAKAIKILPVDTSNIKTSDTKNNSIMSYEPSEEEVLDYVIPKYINTVIFSGIVESSACEQGARMTSMDAATENAVEMIDKLTLVYNRGRQSAITQEINEIVSGASALE
jgi:F-type H+-transporting ATPase subunit gamma